jgi:hypothetical protein
MLRPRRLRTPLVAISLVALAATSACSSGPDDGDIGDGTIEDTSTSLAPAPTEPVDATATDTVAAGSAPTGTGGADGAGGAVVCGELSTTEVATAVGAGTFDTADDVSIADDVTCLYSNSTATYAVSVSREPTTTFLAGELDGASSTDALAALELLLASTYQDGATVTVTPDGDNGSVVVTGTDAILGTPAGSAAAVVDGMVIRVDSDGDELAADAAGFQPIVTNLLALATGA